MHKQCLTKYLTKLSRNYYAVILILSLTNNELKLCGADSMSDLIRQSVIEINMFYKAYPGNYSDGYFYLNDEKGPHCYVMKEFGLDWPTLNRIEWFPTDLIEAWNVAFDNGSMWACASLPEKRAEADDSCQFKGHFLRKWKPGELPWPNNVFIVNCHRSDIYVAWTDYSVFQNTAGDVPFILMYLLDYKEAGATQDPSKLVWNPLANHTINKQSWTRLKKWQRIFTHNAFFRVDNYTLSWFYRQREDETGKLKNEIVQAFVCPMKDQVYYTELRFENIAETDQMPLGAYWTDIDQMENRQFAILAIPLASGATKLMIIIIDEAHAKMKEGRKACHHATGFENKRYGLTSVQTLLSGNGDPSKANFCQEGSSLQPAGIGSICDAKGVNNWLSILGTLPFLSWDAGDKFIAISVVNINRPFRLLVLMLVDPNHDVVVCRLHIQRDFKDRTCDPKVSFGGPSVVHKFPAWEANSIRAAIMVNVKPNDTQIRFARSLNCSTIEECKLCEGAAIPYSCNWEKGKCVIGNRTKPIENICYRIKSFTPKETPRKKTISLKIIVDGITFGEDAHEPDYVTVNLAETMPCVITDLKSNIITCKITDPYPGTYLIKTVAYLHNYDYKYLKAEAESAFEITKEVPEETTTNFFMGYDLLTLSAPIIGVFIIIIALVATRKSKGRNIDYYDSYLSRSSRNRRSRSRGHPPPRIYGNPSDDPDYHPTESEIAEDEVASSRSRRDHSRPRRPSPPISRSRRSYQPPNYQSVSRPTKGGNDTDTLSTKYGPLFKVPPTVTPATVRGGNDTDTLSTRYGSPGRAPSEVSVAGPLAPLPSGMSGKSAIEPPHQSQVSLGPDESQPVRPSARFKIKPEIKHSRR